MPDPTAPAALADHRWQRGIRGPAPSEGDHVGGMQIAELLYDATIDYLVELCGAPDKEAMAALPVRPVLRGVSSEFHGELLGDADLAIGVRTRARSRRSFVLESAMFGDGGRLVATGTASLVMVDVAAGRAAPVPDDLVASMEAADGRPAPVPEPT